MIRRRLHAAVLLGIIRLVGEMDACIAFDG